MSQPVQRTVLVTNRRGLHARASAKFVTLASAQPADIEVEKDGSKVAGTSIMGLMMLGAAMGDSVVITCSGDGAEIALNALCELVEGKFGEGLSAAHDHGLCEPARQGGRACSARRSTAGWSGASWPRACAS